MIIIIMTMPCYKSGKSIMTAACYKGGKSMMTSLIIIKIRFVYFLKDEVDILDYMLDHMLDYMIIDLMITALY